MDPTKSPTKKRRKIAIADVNVDMISELGDDLLILILSLLSTKEAVQTSLLSRRFLDLWQSIPVLNFDFHEFRLEEDQDEDDISEIQENFTNFINGVFQHRAPIINLDSFQLKWDEEESNPEPATTWLDKAAKFKLKFLSVHIFTENYYFQVPDSVFSCESLQEMEIHLEGEAIRPMSVNLPCLKKLSLDCIRIVDEVMQKLLGLPSLEEMVLSDCDLNTCNISSATLKRLELDCKLNADTTPDVSISTPNLLYLKIHSGSMEGIKLKKLESLVKACLHYHHFDNEIPLFLTGLSNATFLELMLLSQWSVWQMKHVLEEETTKFPIFNNLKTLKIGEWCMTDEFDLVARFLFHARNLEKLTLLHCHCQSHYKVEISLGFSGNNFRIVDMKGNNFNMEEIKGREKDKFKADIRELLKRVYNTLQKIRPEMEMLFMQWRNNKYFKEDYKSTIISLLEKRGLSRNGLVVNMDQI